MNSRDEHLQIDEFALATGLTTADGRADLRHNQIMSGRACGYRVLASAILLSGIRRALGAPVPYDYSSPHRRDKNTVEAARQFVLSDWALLLAEYAGLDLDMFNEHRERWAIEWEVEQKERKTETAQHERLPDSLLPLPHLRSFNIWGRP